MFGIAFERAPTPQRLAAHSAMLDDFAMVSLADVLGAATLLTRIDHKYMVPLDALPALMELLDLPVLEIEGRRVFRYESVYFDTPAWSTYLASAHRRRRRLKVRTRSYLDSSTCMLELKSKGYRDQTVKERIGYDRHDRGVLTGTARAFLAGRAPDLAEQQLSAALTTTYRRSSFADLAGGARVTIDTDLVCEDNTGHRVGTPGFAIVETKSANGSCQADHVLWNAGYRPDSISKYGLGVAALHPELPSNKWHRTLRRYIGAIA
jgi:VTC domain